MINNKRVMVVLPAYNAAATLERTIAEIPGEIVDDLLLVDDASRDETVEVAARLGLPHVVHPRNRGYGGNQKTCYTEALRRGADIVIMLHPDYQYTPKLIGAMAWLVASDEFDVVLGSRILGTGALAGGMPLYKYIANRFLTAAENVLLGVKLSEYHTGYRAFSRAGAGDPAAGGEQRRLRVRQPDAGPGVGLRLPDRRDQLPDEVLPRGVVDQLPPLGDLWVGGTGHGGVVPAAQVGGSTKPAAGVGRPSAADGARADGLDGDGGLTDHGRRNNRGRGAAGSHGPAPTGGGGGNPLGPCNLRRPDPPLDPGRRVRPVPRRRSLPVRGG